MKKLAALCLILTKFSLANTPHLYALHINGINTTRMEARINYEALEKAAQVDSNMVYFNLIWNPTGDDAGKNLFTNLNDVIRQKAQEQQAIMSLDENIDKHYWIYY